MEGRVNYRWTGGEYKPRTERVKVIISVIQKSGEAGISEVQLFKELERLKIETQNKRNIYNSIGDLKNSNLVKITKNPSQLEILAQTTGLSKKELIIIGNTFRRYGVFPLHAMGQYSTEKYSPDEWAIICRAGELRKSGMPRLVAGRLALVEQYGENSDKVAIFDQGHQNYLLRSSLNNRRRGEKRFIEDFLNGRRTPLESNYNTLLRISGECDKAYSFVLDRLSADFHNQHKDLFNSFPFNLYFDVEEAPYTDDRLEHIKQGFVRYRHLYQGQHFKDFEHVVFTEAESQLRSVSLQLNEIFREALNKLGEESPKNARVIKLRYASNNTTPFKEVAKQVGLTTKQGASYLGKNALVTLRSYDEIKELPEMLFSL